MIPRRARAELIMTMPLAWLCIVLMLADERQWLASALVLLGGMLLMVALAVWAELHSRWAARKSQERWEVMRQAMKQRFGPK